MKTSERLYRVLELLFLLLAAVWLFLLGWFVLIGFLWAPEGVMGATWSEAFLSAGIWIVSAAVVVVVEAPVFRRRRRRRERASHG